MERYARQRLLPEIGSGGQERLAASRVLVLGAGGLGAPVLYYLAAAGVGTLGILDYDRVSLSNLNRQILYDESALGNDKATEAAQRLRHLNSRIRFVEHRVRLDASNAETLFAGYDVIAACVDTLSVRVLAEKTALALDKPIVEAGIDGFHGFVLSVRRGTACFACMNPVLGTQKDGIPALGATAGTAGSLQAAECLKILLQVGKPLYSRALVFDLLRMEFDEVALVRSPNCPICGGYTRSAPRAE